MSDSRSASGTGSAPRRVAVLGSTGSIGTTALRVLARHPARFSVAALTAHSNHSLLREQVLALDPEFVGLVGEGGDLTWRSGETALVEAASLEGVDIVLNAVVGAAGLDATLAALELGRRVALANKESLVMGGHLVAAASARGGGEIVPVDSEHSAILQCLAGRPASDVRRLVITASGGPFRDWAPHRLDDAAVSDALRHPTWLMGRKITIDSATLANKALEVIEAHYLFGIPYDRIEVVVHPQSVVHSLVELVDGSVIAQLGAPSMELPILYALSHPDRICDLEVPRFDPVAASPLTFEPVRHEQFPMLGLGIAAGRRGGAAAAVFNAANEQAVSLYLDGAIKFGDIPRAVSEALTTLSDADGESRGSLLAADVSARRLVREWCRMKSC